MLGLMGFAGSLPLYVIHRYYIFVFIDRANKDVCLLVCLCARLLKNACMDLDEMLRVDKCRDMDKLINF